MELNKLTIEEAHRGLKSKDFSAVELTEACFDSIRKQDEKLNAFITITEDKALIQAEKVDSKIKNSHQDLNVLEGIPVAIKDNILVQDVKCTAGSKILESYVATYDATVIEKLKIAGSIIVGKTNMDEFAMGSSGETSNYGPTKNPIDLTRVPGGSSSGSTVSVASHESIFALGTDTGGSVRLPASFCGVVGFKPSYGSISRHGVIAMASSFDQVGVLSKTVKDSAYVYEALAGIDKFDSTTKKHKINVLENIDQDIKGKRIGLPKEFFIEGMDPAVRDVVTSTVKKLEALGAEVVEVSLPRTKYALAIYYILVPAEVSSNMARFDGVRYGYRAESANLLEMYLKTRQQGFGDEVRRRIMLGTYVLSSGYYDAYYKKAQQVRRLIQQDFEEVFKTVDLLLTPTSPTTAFALGEKSKDPLTMYLADVFTVSVNVAGLPAMVLPAGLVNKLPVGVQLIGKQFDEPTLFNIAQQLEKKL
ncbi:MAG: Glutamyl-tRNA(Gln) amidotransferase subunit A [Parcubacteria group bacterium GW2011_GWC2_38_7]|nr:MAG: Glutamyl-tRNA(Gln) amidotransferase subunit A [Parcubacteria group bacterium GW2011_GWC2_38_7]